MSALISLLRPITGLFVDDGWLAFAILCIVALAAFFALFMPGLPLMAGGILLFGCIATLLADVVRAAQHKSIS
jgi:uncharacterized membrane protein YdjX (TVP38/TMEM64 family)